MSQEKQAVEQSIALCKKCECRSRVHLPAACCLLPTAQR